MGKKKEVKLELKSAAKEPKEVAQPPKSEIQNSCHDIIFALLFLAAFTFTIGLSIIYGKDVLSAAENQNDINMAADYIKVNKAKYRYALRICAVVAGGTLLVSLIWTLVMLLCGKMLIWVSVVAICTISVGSGFAGSSFLYKQGEAYYWAPAGFSSLFAFLVLLYVCCIKRRIAFASANLQVACKATLSYPVIMLISISFTLFQIVWTLIWIIATYAAINHGAYIDEDTSQDYSSPKKAGILIGMLIIFFWGAFVMRNIIMVTTAGTVSTWWHHNSKKRLSMTATTALCRALTLSFGSICFGSLVVSLIQTIRIILCALQQQLSKSGNAVASCLVGCLGCIVGCIQKWIEYFTRFAYAYIGIYGYSFVSSGKRVCQLFEAKGWSAISNDSLIFNVLIFGKIVVGFAGAAAGWGAATMGDPKWTENLQQPEAALGLSGFLIGYSVADVITTVIDGAVATVFILFAEDPHAIKTTHPSSHEQLHTTWKKNYPTEYEAALKNSPNYPSGTERV